MFETVAREQMVDAAARAIDMDPLEWRRRNVVPTAELPYTLPTGLPLDMVSPAETLEQAAEIIGYDAFRAEQQRAFAEDGRLLGIGLGLYVEPSTGMMDPMGTETAVVRVDPDGQVTVSLGTGAHGQGIETTMAQVVAEELGIDIDDVIVVQGDSAVTAYGRGTGGSGTAVIAGNSCRHACAEVRAKAIEIAAHLMEAAPDDLEIVDGADCREGNADPVGRVARNRAHCASRDGPVARRAWRSASKRLARSRRHPSRGRTRATRAPSRSTAPSGSFASCATSSAKTAA